TVGKMETAKALVEAPAARRGTSEKLHGQPGDVIKVGSPLVTWADGERPSGSNGTAATDERRESTHIEQDQETHRQGEEVPEELSRAQATIEDEEPAEEGPRKDAGTVVGKLSELGGVSAEPGKVLAAPAVRRLARDRGVDLAQIRGSGIGGRVTAADVQ